MQELKNQILSYVSKNGPVLPVKLAQEFKTSLLMASALLSELVSTKKLKITNAKVGSSPMYYVSGQEPKLSILHKSLNQREREAYELLEKRKVLRDKKLQPRERVAIRDIKDFAFPINVKLNEQEEIFWRWHLLPESVAKDLIIKIANVEEKTPELPKPEEKKEIVEKKEEIKPEQPKIENDSPKEEIKEEKKKEAPKEDKKEIVEKKEEIKPEQPKIKKKEIQKPLIEENLIPESKFDTELFNFFENQGFSILTKKIVRKNTDHEFIISVPSQIGQIKLFTKAKSKAKVSDADLSLALSNAKEQNLPLLFLAKGDPTKKAKEFMEKNNILFRQLQ